MDQAAIIEGWEKRAAACNASMVEVRRLAKIHAPNFTNWKKGKTGITLASMQRIDAALAHFEALHSADQVVLCEFCKERIDNHVVNACTATDCPRRERDAA